MLKKIIFLPVGSYEYHGDLLPSETDTIIANKIAFDLNNDFHNSILLPVINYGVSTEHTGFDATITVKNENYYAFMYQLVESIEYKDALIVVINAHGGNVNILRAVESEYNYTHSDCKMFVPTIYNKEVIKLCEDLLGEYDAHAGSVETSLMSHYKFININKKIIYKEDFVKKMPSSLRFFRTIEVNPLGVIKDTNRLIVNSNYGHQIHDLIVFTLSAELKNILNNLNKIIKK